MLADAARCYLRAHEGTARGWGGWARHDRVEGGQRNSGQARYTLQREICGCARMSGKAAVRERETRVEGRRLYHGMELLLHSRMLVAKKKKRKSREKELQGRR
jgi:hypothetical protein